MVAGALTMEGPGRCRRHAASSHYSFLYYKSTASTMAFKISGSHIIADSSEEEILTAGPMRRKAQRAGFRRMFAVAALVERIRPVGGESPPTSPAAVQAVKPAKAKSRDQAQAMFRVLLFWWSRPNLAKLARRRGGANTVVIRRARG